MDPTARLAAAIAAIDEANADDPEQLEHRGERGPKELLHARMATEWVRRLDPAAGEAQLLAARAHHFRRWTSPRSAYPEGRAGYLRWRRDAARTHAAEVGALLTSHGYDDATVDRVGEIIRKERRAADPQVQTHEDALCLVFLDTQLDDVVGRLGPEAALPVLVRTLDKMSPLAIEQALRLDLSESGASMVDHALQERAAGQEGAGEQRPASEHG